MAVGTMVGWIALLAGAGTAHSFEHYSLDSTNTQVSFVVQHLGFQLVSAHFPDINGEFVLDRAGAQSRVDVTVGIATIQSSEPRWNDRLRSAEWLDVARYPQMTYHSSHIEVNDRQAIASGNLTLHGITRPVILTVSFLDCRDGESCRFSAHGRIRRSEFGLPHGFFSGGDQVEISISGAPGPGPQ